MNHLNAAPTPARGSFRVDAPPLPVADEDEGTVIICVEPTPGASPCPCASPGPSPDPCTGGGMLAPPSLVAGRLPSKLSLQGSTEKCVT